MSSPIATHRLPLGTAWHLQEWQGFVPRRADEKCLNIAVKNSEIFCKVSSTSITTSLSPLNTRWFTTENYSFFLSPVCSTSGASGASRGKRFSLTLRASRRRFLWRSNCDNRVKKRWKKIMIAFKSWEIDSKYPQQKNKYLPSKDCGRKGWMATLMEKKQKFPWWN